MVWLLLSLLFVGRFELSFPFWGAPDSFAQKNHHHRACVWLLLTVTFVVFAVPSLPYRNRHERIIRTLRMEAYLLRLLMCTVVHCELDICEPPDSDVSVPVSQRANVVVRYDENFTPRANCKSDR